MWNLLPLCSGPRIVKESIKLLVNNLKFKQASYVVWKGNKEPVYNASALTNTTVNRRSLSRKKNLY